MSIPSLQGEVGKCVLLLSPGAAAYEPLVHFVKFRLYDAGFIVVRQEYRFINAELSAKLCVQLDHVPSFYDTTAAAPCPPGLLTGTCLVFVVARSDCHAHLQAFSHALLTDEETYPTLIEEAAGAANYNASTGNPLTVASSLWFPRTSVAAPRAVQLLFPSMLALHVPAPAQGREYTQETLKPALLAALAQLGRTRPQRPIEALAHALLENNTQQPPMVQQD